MDSTNIKTPKLNVSTIKSPLSDGGSDLGNVGQGGTSKVGTLAKIVRKNRISINSLVKSQEVQNEKITRLKNISQIKQQNVDKKLKNISQIKQQNAGKKSPAEDISSSLAETNKILVAIQSQLALQSQNEQKEEKENIRRESAAESKRKLKREESTLEKTAKGIGKAVGKVALKIVQPISGIFDKILEFITLMGAGIATNAAFEWFKDEENQKKITKFFNILKENWKLIRNILLTFAGVVIGAKILAAAKIIMSALTLLASPAGIAAITALSIFKFVKDSGDASNRLLEEEGIDPEKAKVVGSEENKKATELLTKQASNPLTGGMLVPTLVQQQLGPDGEPKPRIGKKVTSKFDVPLFAPIFQFLDQEGYKKFLEDKKQKLETEEKPEQRKMGGPVIAGRPYIVGDERGLETAEIFVPNVNGSIVNNMRTQKIIQTLSSDMGEGSINMIELPPITNQLPPPEIPVPSGPATEVPEVSSVNLADPYRQLTPMLYGITV